MATPSNPARPYSPSAPPNMDLSISQLHTSYANGDTTPRDIISKLHEEIQASDSAIWISIVSEDRLEGYLAKLDGESPETLPLFGVPFAIKDNIDLEGSPTTAGCPDYSFDPDKDAFVVNSLIAAGAIPMGKTNLDQFATGLVGVRSPYGVPANPFNADYVPGGSSSGSAVAVARDLVTFSLGTDTAGSGRVPAGLNELIGVKPSFGLLSCSGVVPACRSLDCVSIFTKNPADAEIVLNAAKGFDSEDEYSRKPSQSHWFRADSFTFGVPEKDQLEFFGDSEAEALFYQGIERLKALGGTPVTIEFSAFLEAALLLYEGPWVSERFAAIESFLLEKPDSVYPVTRKIIEGGGTPKAVDAFRSQYRLKELKRKADSVLATVDLIVTPTAGTAYTVEEVEADPVKLNSNLGYYTNFMNLLDCCACAIPVGRLDAKGGVPWGITLFAPAFSDEALLSLSNQFLAPEKNYLPTLPEDWIEVVVCGAHMRGLPLNFQLTDRGARFLGEAKTADCYRLFALPATESIPPRPGITRTNDGEGNAYAVERWAVPADQFGSFVAAIPSPLGFGKVVIEDGNRVSGFLCEEIDTHDAENISHLSGWREYLESLTGK